jgi:hypothetical protein
VDQRVRDLLGARVLVFTTILDVDRPGREVLKTLDK